MEHPGAISFDAKARHDLRNQLGIILGYAEILIADGGADDPRRPDIEEIRQAAVNALELLDRIQPGASGTP